MALFRKEPLGSDTQQTTRRGRVEVTVKCHKHNQISKNSIPGVMQGDLTWVGEDTI